MTIDYAHPQTRLSHPVIVACRRGAMIPGFCTSHQDCRAKLWEDWDRDVNRIIARGKPVPPKSRRR